MTRGQRGELGGVKRKVIITTASGRPYVSVGYFDIGGRLGIRSTNASEINPKLREVSLRSYVDNLPARIFPKVICAKPVSQLYV